MLNALRHQRFRHKGDLPREPIRTNVLNALRHQRFRHIRRCGVNHMFVKCSTPYGIKGSGTSLSCQKKTLPCRAQRLTASKVPARHSPVFMNHKSIVLNALRHQRFRHSLSKWWSLSLSCAQRLTASKVPALVPLHYSPRRYLVLNALRHQRFRHQLYGCRFYNSTKCSTPYGIKGSGTSESRG